jgi:hypothetical protein
MNINDKAKNVNEYISKPLSMVHDNLKLDVIAFIVE